MSLEEDLGGLVEKSDPVELSTIVFGPLCRGLSYPVFPLSLA